jgi:hypothetical protein
MVFGLGLFTLGIACALCSSRPVLGLVWLSLGGVAIATVRPHLLLVAAVGGVASVLVRRPRPLPGTTVIPRRTGPALFARGVLLVGLAVMLVVGMGRMNDVVGAPADDDGHLSIRQALDHTIERTTIGRSAFDTRAVSSPADFPEALVSVLYRPFPFEARSGPATVASIEGLVLLALTPLAARWLWRIGPTMVRDPFAAYCGAFAIAFVVAFSNVGNAGILARQRVQLFPVLMLLVAATAAQAPVRPGARSGLARLGAPTTPELIDRRIPALT